MPSDRRRALGGFGESAAAAHLTRHGMAIVARNWRCSIGEIDLVARAGDEVVFVEVRARRAGPIAPEETISPAKARRLAALAEAYLQAAQIPEHTPWRIDMVAVVVGPGGQISRLSHIESAIEAG
jgi:putative endonuclease